MPASINAGAFAFGITVNGAHFLPTSVVNWNGVARATTHFIDSTTLTVNIGPSDVVDPGTVAITVANPGAGGGISNAVNFIINPVPPFMTGFNPNTIAAGGPDFGLTVFGSGFRNSDVIQWNGQSRGTRYNGSASLTATIAASDIATAGTATVRVFDSASGLASGTAAYTITALPPPQFVSTIPENGVAGATSLTIDVLGSHFVSGMAVQVSGDPRPTTFIDSTRLRATLASKDLASATVLPMNIRNPATGQLSNEVYFVVSLTATPGPIVPIPANLWQPPPSVLPASGNYLYVESDSGDYIGGGHTALITGPIAIINLGGVIAATRLEFSISDWSLFFTTMAGVPQFVPGYYANVNSEPINGAGALSVFSPGRGCGDDTGWFAVDSVSYASGVIASFTARFEQRCYGATAALHGIFHWAQH